jgi:hypothetical protein
MRRELRMVPLSGSEQRTENGSQPALCAKPIFDSLKSWLIDNQRLAKTTNGLGTTFTGSLVLGSCLLPQRRRQGNSRRHKRLVRLPHHLTA